MVRQKLSYTKEDYVRAIYILSQREKGSVRVKDISNYLGLGKSTVSERLDELNDANLVKFEKYSLVELAKQGKKIAEDLTRRHRLIEVFLYEKLHFPLKKLHEEADKLEHGFSGEAIKRLDKFLGHPDFDPHGEKIKK